MTTAPPGAPAKAIGDAGPLADRAAFRELYRATADEVYRYARRRVDHHEAEDATAETYVRAWRSRHTYRDDGRPPVAWLIRIAQRVMIDRAAHAARQIELDGIDDGGGVSFAQPIDGPADLGDQDLIARYLACLPVRQREVLHRRFLLDQPVEQVADAMGLSGEAVRALTYRSLGRLRANPSLPDATYESQTRADQP